MDSHLANNSQNNSAKSKALNDFTTNYPLTEKLTLFYEDIDSNCSILPYLDGISFEDLESDSETSEEGKKQSEALHTDVFGVARYGAISVQTLFLTSKLGLELIK
jgi:hypothetical protein